MEALLAELEPLLYGYNYQVFLRVYHTPYAPGAAAEWYINLGDWADGCHPRGRTGHQA